MIQLGTGLVQTNCKEGKKTYTKIIRTNAMATGKQSNKLQPKCIMCDYKSNEQS
jgi:hypothetical protein